MYLKGKKTPKKPKKTKHTQKDFFWKGVRMISDEIKNPLKNSE